MDMDTNKITINRIVGFEWDEAGTDLEDEMPTPVSSPTQIVVPVIPPAGTADPFGVCELPRQGSPSWIWIPTKLRLIELSDSSGTRRGLT